MLASRPRRCVGARNRVAYLAGGGWGDRGGAAGWDAVIEAQPMAALAREACCVRSMGADDADAYMRLTHAAGHVLAACETGSTWKAASQCIFIPNMRRGGGVGICMLHLTAAQSQHGTVCPAICGGFVRQSTVRMPIATDQHPCPTWHDAPVQESKVRKLSKKELAKKLRSGTASTSA